MSGLTNYKNMAQFLVLPQNFHKCIVKLTFVNAYNHVK
jgi:hypothetical protein